MATANFANRTLYHGDNTGFNEGRDFHATPDSLAAGAEFEDQWNWDRDVRQDWIDAI